jgi:hypothetical protein
MGTTTTLLAAASIAPLILSAPSPPTPAAKYVVGEVVPRSAADLPTCGVGYGYVVIDGDRAILVGGSGHYVQLILKPGQTVSDGLDGKLTFNRDRKSVTYNDYEHGNKLDTDVCERDD